MEFTLGLILFLLLLSVRYAEKKWIPRDPKSKTSGVVVERILPSKAGSGTVSVGNTKRTENLVEERKIPQLFNNSGNISAPQNGRNSALPKLAKQVNMIKKKKKAIFLVVNLCIFSSYYTAAYSNYINVLSDYAD